MSWDVVLFNSNKKIVDPAEIEEDQLITISFLTVFNNHFKNIVKNENYYEITGDGYLITFFDDNEPTSNMLLFLYGENAIYPIIDLAIKNNWQIFDTGLGEIINLKNPQKNGYQNFQAYLNHVLNSKA